MAQARQGDRADPRAEEDTEVALLLEVIIRRLAVEVVTEPLGAVVTEPQAAVMAAVLEAVASLHRLSPLEAEVATTRSMTCCGG